ncbi:hypothetical protein ACQZ4Q_01620 [Agrobacterium vitis]
MYHPDRVESLSQWAIPYETEALGTLVVKQARPNASKPVDPREPTKETVVVHLRKHQEHAKARFRMLRRLGDNHDGEGARAANPRSVDNAIAFIDRHSFGLPMLATLDDDGLAVIEVQSIETGIFADITFRSDGTVEVYFRENGNASQMIEGEAYSADVRAFINQFDVR